MRRWKSSWICHEFGIQLFTFCSTSNTPCHPPLRFATGWESCIFIYCTMIRSISCIQLKYATMTKVKHFHHQLKIGMLSTFLVIPPARPVPSLIYVRHQFVGKPSICDVLLMYISKIKHKLHSWISGSETSMNMFNNIESEALGTEKWEKTAGSRPGRTSATLAFGESQPKARLIEISTGGWFGEVTNCFFTQESLMYIGKKTVRVWSTQLSSTTIFA